LEDIMASYKCIRTHYKHAEKRLYEAGEGPLEFDKNPGPHFKRIDSPKAEEQEKNIDVILDRLDSLGKQKVSLEKKIEKDPKDKKLTSALESTERKIAALEKAIQG